VYLSFSDIDFHIGLPKDQHHRVARMTLPSIMDTVSEIMSDYRILMFVASLVGMPSDTLVNKVFKNPSWLQAAGGVSNMTTFAKLILILQIVTFNNPDYHRMEQAAAIGIGNARSLAEIFQLTLQGKIIRKETLQLISKPYINETDIVSGMHMAKGYGFWFEPLRRNNTKVG
jgi:hypothetical protein